MISFVSLALFYSLSFNTPLLPVIVFPDSSQLPSNKTASGVYISGWLAVLNLSHDQNKDGLNYTTKQQLPELNEAIIKEGVVLTFVKGFATQAMPTVEKPLQLPFYLFSGNRESKTAYYWQSTSTKGELEVNVQMTPDLEPGFTQEKENVQLCYFILDKSFLKKHKLTSKDARRLSYQQLIELTATAQ